MVAEEQIVWDHILGKCAKHLGEARERGIALSARQFRPYHIGYLANSNSQFMFRVSLAPVSTEKWTGPDMQIFLRQPNLHPQYYVVEPKNTSWNG